ncbi:MAG: prepilin-type N-terminal cleavage/methylation domain-containing protein [Gammaproteobacteria bacterium]|nr:prepilin-type N-terminal cleavage/methylation domain-containing protein [Gammaproteobacteria bacterium]
MTRNLYQRGFSLLELVVVITVVAVLAGVFLRTVPAWQARAEEAAMETVLGNLRSALNINVAAHIAKNETGKIAHLIRVNPMTNLADKPENYVGIVTDSSNVDSRVWYYDNQSKELVYVVANHEGFVGGEGNPPRVKFVIKPVYVASSRRGQLAGLKLVSTRPYGWNFN